MNLSIRRLELLAASAIALAVIDLPTLVIDVFAIPLPRLAFGMSWLTGAALAVVVLCWPMRRESPSRMFDLWDVAYVASLIVWAVLEYMRGGLDTVANVSAILAWVPPWIVSLAVRAHVSVFGRVEPLVRTFVWTVTVLGITHLAVVALATAGVRPPLIRIDELIDRNSISLLLTTAAFALVVWERQDRPQRAWWLIGVVVLGFAHAELNHARAAKLVLVLIVTIQIARMTVFSDRGMVRVCLLLASCIAATVVGLSAVLQGIARPDVFGAGDAAVSTAVRGDVNLMLLNLFLSHPWVGAGLEQVAHVRSGGYVGHTLYLNVAAAFGIVGLLPALTLMLSRRLRGTTIAVELSMTLLLVTAVASFFNDPQTWFGFVLALSWGLRNHPAVVRHGESQMTASHFRAFYPVAAGVALVTFGFLAWWMVQRAPFVASGELEFAETAVNYKLTAVEASSEAEEFVQVALLQHAESLADRCSISGPVERQALIVTCNGDTETEATRAVDQILRPVLERQNAMFEEQRRAAELMSQVDHAVLQQLHERAKRLERQDPVDGSRPDDRLLSFVNLQRAGVMRNLMLYESTKKREHPSRVVGGVRSYTRPPRLVLCSIVASAAALVVLLSLALGAAGRDALSRAGARSY